MLDSRAGYSFIGKDVITTKLWSKVKPSRNVNVRDAGNHKVHTSGTINIAVKIGNNVEMVTFNVVERLSTNILLGYNCFDLHIEVIKSRQRLVELDDGMTATIVRNLGEESTKQYSSQKPSNYEK